VNKLYFGDNIDVLRRMPNASVELIYLDPPFNSNAAYGVLFGTARGGPSQAQARAFEDIWRWGQEAQRALEETAQRHLQAGKLLDAFQSAFGGSNMMAYLAMMAVRLIELNRVLTPTGSIYLHCDPTASHYLKIVMDSIFGPKCYRSEITWKRSTSHGNVGKNYGNLRDVILFYTKSDQYTWNQQHARLSDAYIQSKFTNEDANGRWQSVSLRNPSVRPRLQYDYTASNGVTYKPHPNGWAVSLERLKAYDAENRLHFPASPTGQLRLKQYLHERPGVKLQNIWDDIPAVNSQARERLYYSTQKPLALLERIIRTSSNEGDIVLDPFCGCGTAVEAAERLRRRWIGIDVIPASLMFDLRPDPHDPRI
jgi:site-specific DNA-methyltransferase (adenine-specific)